MYKDGLTREQVAEKVLRGYLIRRFKDISSQWPAIMSMSPEEGADHLLKLRTDNKIRIELESVGNHIE